MKIGHWNSCLFINELQHFKYVTVRASCQLAPRIGHWKKMTSFKILTETRVIEAGQRRIAASWTLDFNGDAICAFVYH